MCFREVDRNPQTVRTWTVRPRNGPAVEGALERSQIFQKPIGQLIQFIGHFLQLRGRAVDFRELDGLAVFLPQPHDLAGACHEIHRELCAGQQFYGEIAGALAGCKVAIVIWTVSSIVSRWVLGEAETAASAEKLIPVREDSLSERQLPI